MKTLIKLLQIAILATLFISCGSSSSSGGGNKTHKVSGTLTAVGPIEGALVWADSEQREALSVPVRTDKKGKFTISLPSKPNGKVHITIRGGFLSNLGVDLKTLELQQSVTPSTQMKLNLAKAMGAKDSDEKANIKIAQVIKEASTNDYDKIKEAFDGKTTDEGLNTLKTTVPNLQATIQALGNVTDAKNFKLSAIQEAMILFLENTQILTSADFTNDVNNTIKTLAQNLLSATEDVLPTDLAQANIYRTLVSYEILDKTKLQNASIPSDLKTFADKVNASIKNLRHLRVLDIAVSLSEKEYLKTNEQAREYFFNSNLSPLYKVNVILKDVIDQNIVDDVFMNVARELSRNSFFDKAIEVADTLIFTPNIKANTYRRIGLSYKDQNKNDKALEFFEKALNSYPEVDVSNFSAKDAIFFRSIWDNLETLNGKQDLKDAVENNITLALDPNTQYLTKTYSQLITALWKKAKADVESFEAGNLSKEDAKASVDALKEYTDKARTQPDNMGSPTGASTTGCQKTKAMYTARYADFYMRIDEKELAKTGTKKFLDLVDPAKSETGTCRAGGQNYFKWIAHVYAYTDEVGKLSTFINDPSKNVSAKNAASAFKMIVIDEVTKSIIKDGSDTNIDAQIKKVDDFVKTKIKTADQNRTKIEMLTNLGKNQGTKYIALRLYDKGKKDEAKKILAKAKALALDNGFINENIKSYSKLVDWSCANIASLYKQWGELNTAKNVVTTCYDRVKQEQASQNSDVKVENFIALAKAKMIVDDNTSANSIATDDAISIVDNVSDVDDKSNMLYSVINNIYIETANLDGFKTAMTNLQDLNLSSLSEKTQAMKFLNQAKLYNKMIIQLRKVCALGNTDLTPAQSGFIKEVRKNKLSSIYQKAIDATKDISTPKYKQEKLVEIAGLLANHNLLNAKEVIDLASTSADKNAIKKSIAIKLAAHDDFSWTDVASFDFDFDNKPDFFSAGATNEQKTQSGLKQDDDIDGDTKPNANDETPYKK